MEENKIPTPPSQMRKMPPPPPRPKAATQKPVAPQQEPVAPKVVERPAEPVAPQETAPKATPKVEEAKVEKPKKMKKEGVEEDLDNIGLVDVRQTKKVDTKAMIYYIGIFVSLALMAVIIFLLLK